MKKVILMLSVLLMAAITACGGSDSGKEYKVYYKDKSGYRLVEKTMVSDTEDLAQLAYEIIEQMNQPPKSDDYKVIKFSDVELKDIVIRNKVIYLYYNEQYQRMDTISEILYRTGVVKALTQLDGIEYVSIYQNGEPLRYSNGSIIGLMNEEDFVDDADSSMSNLQWADLKLYFANETGDKLTAQTVQVAYSKSVSIERVIVEQLIAGPNGSELKATLPSDLTVFGVNVKNGVCYVNLSSQMTTSMVNVSAEVSIYSIVNSLCELGNITGVSISIDGHSDIYFRETINLDSVLKSNIDIVTN